MEVDIDGFSCFLQEEEHRLRLTIKGAAWSQQDPPAPYRAWNLLLRNELFDWDKNWVESSPYKIERDLIYTWVVSDDN